MGMSMTAPRHQSSLTVERLGPALGAAVSGVDLNAPVEAATFAAIKAAFHEHLVLLFRDQWLAPAAQVAFTERFGRVEGHPLKSRRALGEAAGVHVLENLPGHRGGRNDWWHSDISFGAIPPALSVLHAREIPENGKGDTLFCNMYAAYANLSPGLRRMLDGLTAVHDARKLIARNESEENDEQPISLRLPPAEHPAVRTHPETGRRALYVNDYFTHRFGDMTEAESRPLLDFLIAQATRPENVYRHRWRKGDVIMWDNRCTMHYALYDYGPSEVRVMHRTTAAGDRPR
jgi:taurine dioxygenase